MSYNNYSVYKPQSLRKQKRHKRRKWPILVAILLVLGFGGYKFITRPTVQKAVNQLQFDGSLTESEKNTIRQAIVDQSKTYSGSVNVSAETDLEATQTSSILEAYIPVTNFNSSRQSVTKEELGSLQVYIPGDTDARVKSALASTLVLDESKFVSLSGNLEDIGDSAVAFVPVSQLTATIKLLGFEGAYYLDSFQKGAVFREAIFTGSGAAALSDLKLNSLPAKDTTLKVNMTGVTALTRLMMKKLTSVKNPTYFSEKIGNFLSDADITHVSNEVSFKTGCQYSTTSFCSPPEFIETLKASGVDLVELTGNHNNDQGSTPNTESINQYHTLGWHTYGGGINTTEAAKPYLADQKSSKVTFIAYNLADGPGSGAIAGPNNAGANIYTEAKAKADIGAAKQTSDFVIVNIQYSECQAYPAGYVEYPICDSPIGGQQATFRKLIDHGADMVVGSSAHQPQTYELYKEKPIYYGLGNQYFEQIQWPGTERGIILTHYFVNGKLLQTKLSPTVYDESLQTRLMDKDETDYFLNRLKAARP